MKCIDCRKKCCNNRLHEIINGLISLSYVAQRLKAGDKVLEHIERMDSQLERVTIALKECRVVPKKK